MIRMMSLLFSSALILGLATPAMAQAKGYVGGGIGMSVPNAEDTSARPMYGIIGGARLDGEIGIGGFYFTSSKDETVNNVEVPFDYDLYGLEGSFHFEGVADGAFVAARIGIAKVKTKTAVGTVNYSPMTWGLLAGYDYFLNEHFSLGAEGGFMSVLDDKSTKGDLKHFITLDFLAAAKFWF